MNQYDTSLFEKAHTCPKTHEDEAATAPLHPCCKKALALKKAQACGEKQDGCTKKTTTFVKADLKFLEFKKTELPKIAFISVWDPTFAPVFAQKQGDNYASFPMVADSAPPQYSGRQLLNFIQVYRI
jgi:hypothetical protein